jgi:hypothetical protein
LPDQAWTLVPQTSQLKLPECLCGCCSLVAVYCRPQLGQLKYTVIHIALSILLLCGGTEYVFQPRSLAA